MNQDQQLAFSRPVREPEEVNLFGKVVRRGDHTVQLCLHIGDP